MYDAKSSSGDYAAFMDALAKDFKYTGGGGVEFFLGFRITRDRKKSYHQNGSDRIYTKSR